MKTVVFAVLLWWATIVAAADPPKAVITGPTDGVPGDLIVMDFSESSADKMKVFIEPSRFSDGKPTYQMSKDGMSAYLATRAGTTFRVELVVSNAEGPDRAVLIVTIASPTPSPGPAPAPTPTPTPTPGPVPTPAPAPLPPGRFGLAEFVRAQVVTNIPTAKRGASSGFSGNYGSVAAQIAAGTIHSLADANVKLKALNQATAGADLSLWTTNVFVVLAAKQTALANAKTLDPTNLNDLMTAFNEIRDGFAAAGI